MIAVRSGFITREQAYADYQLSPEELDAWEAAYDRGGHKKITNKAAQHRKCSSPDWGFIGRRRVAIDHQAVLDLAAPESLDIPAPSAFGINLYEPHRERPLSVRVSDAGLARAFDLVQGVGGPAFFNRAAFGKSEVS